MNNVNDIADALESIAKLLRNSYHNVTESNLALTSSNLCQVPLSPTPPPVGVGTVGEFRPAQPKLSHLVRAFRNARGITRHEMAIACGLLPKTINNAENGSGVGVQRKTVQAIATFMNVPCERLMRARNYEVLVRAESKKDPARGHGKGRN